MGIPAIEIETNRQNISRENIIVNEEKGILIVFEGLSGCGKSEKAKKLLESYRQAGYHVCMFEWNSNRVIRTITCFLRSNKLLRPRIYSILQWLDFIINYYFHIMPKLREEYIVIADRYVYTGLTRDAVNKSGTFLGNLLSKFVRKPDLLFYCDVRPDVCYDRIVKRGKVFYHTNQQIIKSKMLKNKNLYYLKKLRYEYLRLFKQNKIDESTNLYFIEEENIHDITLNYLRKKYR